MKLNFPDGFLWGAATSAHQVEGNNYNDWSEWELENAKIKSQNAKSENWPDLILKNYPNPLQKENYISGRACDHYNRFREDFDIAKNLGHNAHRFSVEWSRIEPEEGKWDEKEIQHYGEVISALRERGIEPFVTLWHYTIPSWLAKKGGILNKKSPEYFSKYTKKVAEALGENVKFWITINEPQVFTSYAYFKNIYPPQKNSIAAGIRAMRQLTKMHCQVYGVLHAVLPNAQVGIATSNSFLEPASRSLFDRAVVALNQYLRNRFFLNRIRGFQDFVGINYYSHDRVSFSFDVKGRGGAFIKNRNENEWMDDRGHEIYPSGIYHVLKDVACYGVPLYITENGVADVKDIHREKFIKEHLKWILKAIQEGIEVHGYFHWSLLDNFEWDKGFWPRFGLVEVDYKTLERKIRPSAQEFKKICENNSLEI